MVCLKLKQYALCKIQMYINEFILIISVLAFAAGAKNPNAQKLKSRLFPEFGSQIQPEPVP